MKNKALLSFLNYSCPAGMLSLLFFSADTYNVLVCLCNCQFLHERACLCLYNVCMCVHGWHRHQSLPWQKGQHFLLPQIKVKKGRETISNNKPTGLSWWSCLDKDRQQQPGKRPCPAIKPSSNEVVKETSAKPGTALLFGKGAAHACAISGN